MTKEQEIKNYMEKLDISREEAEQLWKDDHDDIVTPEMAEMEKKAKQIKRYEKSDTPRKKAVRERKPDEIKREIIATVANNLSRCWFDDIPMNTCHLIHVVNPEKEITFRVGEDDYSITLTKHRPKKNQGGLTCPAAIVK